VFRSLACDALAYLFRGDITHPPVFCALFRDGMLERLLL